MLPFEIDTVVICDDIRQEKNGKHLLIGVYGGNIVIAGLPAHLSLSVWIAGSAPKKGRFEIRLRLKGPNESVLVEGQVGIEVHDVGHLTLTLERLPVQLQSVGTLVVELAPIGSEKWKRIKTVEVQLRPAAAPPTS